MTPHIEAPAGAFAPTTLLPGDPLRAKYVAERFLEDATQVTAVRNMLGFTGSYRGTPISVMGTGMGIPSASIYVTELINEYGVERLVRIGSCGAMLPEVALRDVIVATAASTDSNVNRTRFGGYDLAAVGDFTLARQLVDTAAAQSIPVHVGPVFTSDFFYAPNPAIYELCTRYRHLGVEMEVAGLYGAATEHGAQAMALLTVSDHLVTEEKLSPLERQTSFDEMVGLALDALSD